jgi:hypothetical protein
MSLNVKNTKVFVGVDVSKATLNVYRPDTNQAWQIENSEEAIAAFCTQLEKRSDKSWS